MTHASTPCSRRSERRPLAILAILALAALPLYAESSSCNRARAIVEEVKVLYNAPQPDHRAILEKLRTAEQLCPTLGDAWKYAYCSATALGDTQNARIYKDRAVFNNVADLGCGAGVAVQTPLPSYVRQKYALVVGISKFKDASLNLTYPAKDATDFAALLEDPQHGNFQRDHVTLLKDEGATRAAILDAINKLSLSAREDDMVVIFISSHGSPNKEDSGLAGIGYIVTHDTSPDKVWLEGLDYQVLTHTTEVIKARRKVVFLDTCFSGQMKQGGKGLLIEGGVDERTAKMFLSGEGTFVITSSKDDERSWESDKIQNGYFTHFLIEALRSSKEPPTLKEVFTYLSSKVPDAVIREKGHPQHPQMYPSTGPGDVRIGVIPQASGDHS
jgi:hypothetical protein